MLICFDAPFLTWFKRIMKRKNRPISMKVFQKIDNDKFRIKCGICGKRFVSSRTSQEYCDDCKGKNKYLTKKDEIYLIE